MNLGNAWRQLGLTDVEAMEKAISYYSDAALFTDTLTIYGIGLTGNKPEALILSASWESLPIT